MISPMFGPQVVFFPFLRSLFVEVYLDWPLSQAKIESFVFGICAAARARFRGSKTLQAKFPAGEASYLWGEVQNALAGPESPIPRNTDLSGIVADIITRFLN